MHSPVARQSPSHRGKPGGEGSTTVNFLSCKPGGEGSTTVNFLSCKPDGEMWVELRQECPPYGKANHSLRARWPPPLAEPLCRAILSRPRSARPTTSSRE